MDKNILMPKYTACPVCGKPKKKKWNFCHDCLEIYGGKVDEWPEWLRVLRNDTERLRYDDQQSNDNELPLNDFESYIDQYWETTEVLHTRPREETRIITDAYGSVAMAYAPYDDEEMNREYRKANGIPEILNIDDIDPDELDTELLTIF